ncbi:hypothetical protein [Actinomadura luteofluorescens]
MEKVGSEREAVEAMVTTIGRQARQPLGLGAGQGFALAGNASG